MNFFDDFNAPNIVAYYDASKADQQNYLGERLFRSKKVVGLELTKISGYAGVPVELKSSNFGAQATIRDREGIQISKERMPFFREKYVINEMLRQQILSTSQIPLAKTFMDSVFDDTTGLIRGARVRRERMIMELLSTGKITLKDNGRTASYDYGLDKKNQFVTPKKLWGDSDNATPLTDIVNWVNAFRIKYGVSLGYALMTTTTFTKLMQSKEVKETIMPTAVNASNILITPAQIKQIVLATANVQILLYDEVYSKEVGKDSSKLFPDDVVTFFPNSQVLGDMVFGTTPEEIDMIALNRNGGDVAIVDEGVAVFVKTIDHPVTRETIVSQICLPSFNTAVQGGAGSILIANVA